jgi:hypothetical protein
MLELQSPFEQRYPALALQANDVRHYPKEALMKIAKLVVCVANLGLLRLPPRRSALQR